MSEQQGLFTLADASRLSGLSTEALRLRIKRGKLAAEKGNDGQPRVRLTAADLEEFRRQAGQQKSTLTRQDDDKANALRMLEAAVDALREQAGRDLAELRERAAKAEGESAILREQVESERGRADKAEARATKAEAEREAAKVAAASAEGEVRGLRLVLEEARRPFWRRWLG